eukprot:4172502-Prymnesium_polylepis.1
MKSTRRARSALTAASASWSRNVEPSRPTFGTCSMERRGHAPGVPRGAMSPKRARSRSRLPLLTILSSSTSGRRARSQRSGCLYAATTTTVEQRLHAAPVSFAMAAVKHKLAQKRTHLHSAFCVHVTGYAGRTVPIWTSRHVSPDQS